VRKSSRARGTDWQCDLLVGAGFPEAVRPEILYDVLELNDDARLPQLPAKVRKAANKLRELSASFEFKDDNLRALCAADSSTAPHPLVSSASLSHALAFDRDATDRLPCIVLRAYQLAYDYAEHRNSSSIGDGKKHAQIIDNALSALVGDAESSWGGYRTRYGIWRGTPFSDLVDFLREKTAMSEDETIADFEEEVVAIDSAMATLQRWMERLRNHSRRGRPPKFVKRFFVLRLIEVYVLTAGRTPPRDAKIRKRDVQWQDFIECAAMVCGVGGEPIYNVLDQMRDISRVHGQDILHLSDAAALVRRGKTLPTLLQVSALPSSVAAAAVGIGGELRLVSR
jgi:hypothetical protein